MDFNLNFGCPDNNMGGYKVNQTGMTLDPYFNDNSTNFWDNVQKSGNSAKNNNSFAMSQILGGGGPKTGGLGDLRNGWSLPTGQSSPSKMSFGPSNSSVYQNDFIPPPDPHRPILGKEQMRLASFLPPKHNTYRTNPNRSMNSRDWTPKPLIRCAPSIKAPCRQPNSNISNVHMNDGFGTYISETMEQFDRPTAQAYDVTTYETPSGFSTAGGSGLWDTFASCDTTRDKYEVTPPPTRYNPWPRFHMGYKSFLNKDYRPTEIMDYVEGTVARGTTSFDSVNFLS